MQFSVTSDDDMKAIKLVSVGAEMIGQVAQQHDSTELPPPCK